MKRKNIKGILFFTAGAAILYFIFNAAITKAVSKSRSDQLGKINMIANHDAPPTLAFFGSSIGEIDMNAPLIQQKTNLSTYNFSLSGTRFKQYEGLIDEFITNNHTTKFVVMTEAYFSFRHVATVTGLERFMANISNNNIYRSLYSIQPDLVWKCRYVPFYKYTVVSQGYYLSALDGFRRYFKKGSKDTLLGYTPISRNWEADEDAKMRSIKPFLTTADSPIKKAYADCVRRIQSKGMKVIIILPPVYSIVLKTKTDFTPLRKALDEISKETGCIFWDFFDSPLSKDKSLFYNSNHMNTKGSTLFSGMVADSINKIVQK